MSITTYEPVDMTSPDALRSLVRIERGPTGWTTLAQEDVDTFAELTNDRQWIHVDPTHAATGPFGGTIAHGYLTLSLIAHWLYELFPLPAGVTSINYGLNRVRFPAAAPVGIRLRMTARVVSFVEVDGGADVVVDCVIHLEGETRPACVAEPVLRYLAD